METLQQKFRHNQSYFLQPRQRRILVKKKETGERFLLKSLTEQKGVSGDAIQKKNTVQKRGRHRIFARPPNIARPALTFADETTFSILYPYRRGSSSCKICEVKGAIAPDETLLYVQQVLDALEYIHARGIIHCDLNPNNIYINERTGPGAS